MVFGQSVTGEAPAATAADRSEPETLVRLGPGTLVPVARGLKKIFTDPMSNVMSIENSAVRRLLEPACPGAVPWSPSLLRYSLHELTHHATYAGRVGRALAALAISVAARTDVGPAPEGEGKLWLGQRDDLVLRAFQAMNDPLVEGLALFAEHDIRWGECPDASHPLLHTVGLFFAAEAGAARLAALSSATDDPIAAGDAAYAASINDRLSEARRGWVEEKVRLLSQPLFGGADAPAPYLLGYLAVKRAYLQLRSVCKPLDEPDLFLLLMLYYWFSDKETADLLVELNDTDRVSSQQTIGVLAEHIQDLWSGLYRSPMSALRRMATALMEGPVRFAPIDHFTLALGARSAFDAINIFVPRFQKHRLTLRLGVLHVVIATESGEGRASVCDAFTGERLLDCPVVPNSDQGEFPGTVEIVRSYDGRLTAVAVIGPTGLVAVRDMFSADWNDPELVEAFDDLPSMEHAEAAAFSYCDGVFYKSWKDGDLAKIDASVMSQVIAVRDLVHLQRAFPGARAERREEIATGLGPNGLAAIFDDQAELREVARYSLLFGGPGAPVAEVAKAEGVAEAGLAERVARWNERARPLLGVDIFEITDGVVTSAI